MIGVRREADYYNFPELVALYDNACKEALQNWCKTQSSFLNLYAMSFQTNIASTPEELVNVEIYPSCQVGILEAPHWAPSIAGNDNLGRLFINTRESPKLRNFQVSHSMAHQGLLNYLPGNLPTLPGNPCYFTNPQIRGVVKNGNLYVPSVGAVCTNRIGTVIYILRSTCTGGTITATRNGVSKSIANPGEYIMYTSEYTCEFSQITSGALVYVSLDIVREVEHVHSNAGLRKTTLVPHSTLPCLNTILHAVHCELGGSSNASGDIRSDSDKVAVVLCLSTLYPIFEFDPTGPYLATDPEILTDRDAVLYKYLKDNFAVTLVTVLVQRNGKDCKGCVLGPDPTTDCIIKIITPYHNYTESFEMNGSLNASEKWFATLYTAMYITVE